MTTRTTSPPSTEPGPARAGAPVLARRAAFQRALPWVEDAEAGRPVAGAIVGPAGFGKSTLARAILEHAAARGVRTWMVAGLDPALEGLVASRLAAQLSIVDAGTQPAALIRATVEHLQRLGRSGRPVAICFDDLHAFHASDLALAQDLLLTRVPGLLVIATARPGRAASDDLLAHAREMAGARRVDLGPLSLEEATGLLAAVPGLGAVARRFTRDAVALARGEPARLLAIAAAVRDLPAAARGDVISGSRSLETLALPAPLAALALRACEGLDEDALQLLRALAVWGVPASTATLASLTRRNAGAVEDLAVRLERARLLVPAAIHGELGIAIADPLLALALASAPSIERGLLHRRAAQLLERAGAGPLDVPRAIRARHLVAGGLPFEAAAFDAILEAARELIEHSRYASARDLLAPLLGDAAPDRAASVPPEVFVLAAETLSRSGSLDRARKLLEQAGPADPAAPLRAARDLVALGREAQTLPIYRSMLANESLDPATRIRALVDSAWVQHMAGRPRDAERAGRDAARFAEALGDADLGARARLVLSNTHLATGHAGAALREARRAARLARLGTPAVRARATAAIANALTDGGPLARGARWLERAYRRAEACDDFATLSGVAVRLASVSLERGDWKRAEAMAASAMHVDVSLHRILALRRSRAMRTQLNALQGRTDPLDSGLEQTYLGNEGFGGPAIFVPDLVARYEHQRLAGALPQAAATIDRAHGLLSGVRGWERHMALEVLPRVAAVHEALDEADAVRRAAQELDALVAACAEMPVVEALALHARARVAALEARWADACGIALDAAGRLGAFGYAWRRALALADAGRFAVAAGDAAGAEAAFDESYRTLAAIGASPERARIRDELAAIGRRAPVIREHRGRLTAREIEIARLLNAGLTDAEIAARLAVSRRTVTTHVHNLLTKLRVHSRRDVATALADAPTAPVPPRRTGVPHAPG